MYKQVDNYYAILQAAAGQQAYALDFNSMTIRDVAGMTVSEVNNNLTYITEEPQSEENMGKITHEEEKIDTDECEKTRENIEDVLEQPISEEKMDEKESEKPKSSSADTNSKEVKDAKSAAEEKKQKKAEANAKFKMREKQLREIEKWVDLYASGMSKTQIAKEYGKAISTVSTHIEKYVEDVKNKIDMGKFKALRQARWNDKNIALEFHVTEGAITLLIERGM